MERMPNSRPAYACAAAGLAVVASVVFLRRVSGAIDVDLTPGEAALYSTAFAAASSVVIEPLAGGFGRETKRFGSGPAPVLLTLMFAAGLSTGAGSVLASLIAACAVIWFYSVTRSTGFSNANGAGGAEAFQEGTDGGLLPSLSSRFQGNKAASKAVPASQAEHSRRNGDDVPLSTSTPAEGPIEGGDDAAGPALRLERRDGVDGESLEGVIRFELPARETFHVLHVPLWPPLSAEPTVRCDLDGIDGRVRVALAKRHGMRFEIRVPEGIDEPLFGELRFAARCHAA